MELHQASAYPADAILAALDVPVLLVRFEGRSQFRLKVGEEFG